MTIVVHDCCNLITALSTGNGTCGGDPPRAHGLTRRGRTSGQTRALLPDGQVGAEGVQTLKFVRAGKEHAVAARP